MMHLISTWGPRAPRAPALPVRPALLGIAVAGLLTTGWGDSRQTRLGPALTSRCAQAIQAEMQRQEIPGLSVAILHDGRRWEAGFGRADLENNVDATTRTVYRFASVSKPLTAVAILQLAERGQLDLDAPIQRYVPGFPEKSWPVTARHLLAHQAGIRSYRGDEMYSTRYYPSLADALQMFAEDPLECEPGTRFLYSTYGYNLLGAAVEAISGRPFIEHLREHLLEPAGMSATRQDEIAAIIPHRAPGYRRGEDGRLRNSALCDTSNKVSGGGLCGTAGDLVSFADALFDGRLLSPESLRMMTTPVPLKDGVPTDYALGWRVTHREGRTEVWHGGNQPRVTTLLYTRPDDRLAIAILCNLEGAELLELARSMADTLSP